MNTTQFNGATLGALGAAAGAANKVELGAGMFGAGFGGAISSEMSNEGFSRPIANTTGATVGAA
jgi:hypothetical protein